MRLGHWRGHGLQLKVSTFFFPRSPCLASLEIFCGGAFPCAAKRLLRAEQAAPKRSGPQLNPTSVLRVLQQDPQYAKFMLWMSVFGLGNLMISAPLAIVLEDEMNATYAQGILVTTVIPLLIMPLAIPFGRGDLTARMWLISAQSTHGHL